MVFQRDSPSNASNSERDAHLGRNSTLLRRRILFLFHSICPGKSLQFIFAFAYHVDDPGPTRRAFRCFFLDTNVDISIS